MISQDERSVKLVKVTFKTLVCCHQKHKTEGKMFANDIGC